MMTAKDNILGTERICKATKRGCKKTSFLSTTKKLNYDQTLQEQK
jgi:hypothetical protein